MSVLRCSNSACTQAILLPEGESPDAIRCPKCGAAVLPFTAGLTATLPSIPLPDQATTLVPPFAVATPPLSTHLLPSSPAGTLTHLASPTEKLPVTPVPAVPLPDRIGRYLIRQRWVKGPSASFTAPTIRRSTGRWPSRWPSRHALSTENRVQRFLREAKAAGNLRHPNIVPVFDSGQDGERFYIASAYIVGRSLEAELDKHGPDGADDPRRPFDRARAARLVAAWPKRWRTPTGRA